MAYFAQLDDNNTVTRVIALNNEDISGLDGSESESLGISLCEKICGPGKYIQTSRNTFFGIHYDPATWLPDGKPPFRYTFAEIGFKYLPDRDIFAPHEISPWLFLNERNEWVSDFGINPVSGLELSDDEWQYLDLFERLPMPQWPDNVL